MGNMSHCRYRNTLFGLWACQEVMGETDHLVADAAEPRERPIKLCVETAAGYSHEVGTPCGIAADAE